MPLSSLLTIPFGGGEVATSDVRRPHRRNRMARDLFSITAIPWESFWPQKSPTIGSIPLRSRRGTPTGNSIESWNPIKSCSTKKGCLPSRNQRSQLPVDEKEISPSLLLQDLQDNSLWDRTHNLSGLRKQLTMLLDKNIPPNLLKESIPNFKCEGWSTLNTQFFTETWVVSPCILSIINNSATEGPSTQQLKLQFDFPTSDWIALYFLSLHCQLLHQPGFP